MVATNTASLITMRLALCRLISHDADRAAFRILARALAGECELTPDDWRKSRRALVVPADIERRRSAEAED